MLIFKFFQFCNSHAALNLDGCDRLFSLHLFRTLPVGYIHGCLLVCVPSHLHFRVLWVLRHRQHYSHRRGLLVKARFSHFQSVILNPLARVMGNVYVFSRIKVTSSGAFGLCFSTFAFRTLSPDLDPVSRLIHNEFSPWILKFELGSGRFVALCELGLSLLCAAERLCELSKNSQFECRS